MLTTEQSLEVLITAMGKVNNQLIKIIDKLDHLDRQLIELNERMDIVEAK